MLTLIILNIPAVINIRQNSRGISRGCFLFVGFVRIIFGGEAAPNSEQAEGAIRPGGYAAAGSRIFRLVTVRFCGI